MSRLFISYSYIANQGGTIYQGFSNMVGDMYAPQCAEYIEALHGETNKHCIESLGMDTATTTILWWKELDGT